MARLRRSWGAVDAVTSAASNYGTNQDNGIMPGKLGVIQEILRVLERASASKSKLRFPLVAMETLGVFNRYNQRKLEAKSYMSQDKAIEQLKQERDVINVSSELLTGLLSTLPAPDFKHSKVTDQSSKQETGSEILEYEFKKGKSFFLISSNTKSTFNGGDDGGFPWHKVEGPFLREEDSRSFFDWVAESVWKESGGRIASLGFSMNSGAYAGYNQPSSISLTWASKTVDYVSGTDYWNNISDISDRCNKFIKAGMTRGILLSGPPGTGKSSLARMIGSSVGEGRVLQLDGTLIREYPASAISALLSYLQPSAVILDDYDRHGYDSSYALSLLETAAIINPCVFFITANITSRLDPALLRPGRIDEVHKFQVPDAKFRLDIFNYYISKWKIDCPMDRVASLAEETDTMSPAEIRLLCEVMKALGFSEVELAIKRVKDCRDIYSVEAMEKYYEKN